MKLIIAGVGEYDIEEILQNASLNDLYYLKVKTKTEEYPAGVSMKSLGEGMKKWGEFADSSDILDDAEALLNLRSLIFLCRRHGGEKVTVDSANDFPLSAFAFETDENDEPVPADPTSALPASAPAGAHRADTTTSSTTSEPPSTSGSPSSLTSGPE